MNQYSYKVSEHWKEECCGCNIRHYFSYRGHYDRDKESNDRMRECSQNSQLTAKPITQVRLLWAKTIILKFESNCIG